MLTPNKIEARLTPGEVSALMVSARLSIKLLGEQTDPKVTMMLKDLTRALYKLDRFLEQDTASDPQNSEEILN